MNKKITAFALVVFSFLFSFSVIFADNTKPVTPTSPATSNSICEKASMGSLEGIINWASCVLIRSVVPLLFSIAIVAFIYGVIQFYINPDNEEKRKKGKAFIVGGLIALFVMTSVWGIVGILKNTFETNSKNSVNVDDLPQIK